MIYMVEMALLELARRTEWDAWYVAHQHHLLTIPGFRASQRFETIHPADSPFVALHQIDSADLFTSPAYRASAGPTNTGEWQKKMNNWHRNLFARDTTPDVPPDMRLVVVEDGANAESIASSIEWMEAVGLDKTVKRRGLTILPPSVADELAGTKGIRVAKPIGARLRSKS